MSSEISVVRKGLLGRKIVRKYERWDDMSQDDFIAFCAVLNRSYFDNDGRAKMAAFLDDIKVTSKVLVKRLKCGFTTLYAPLDRFSLVRYGELSKADVFFDKYMSTGSDEMLYYFVACLYREKRKGVYDDVRVSFDEDKVSARAKLISRKADKDALFAIALNYAAVMEWMMSRYKFLFPPPDNSQKNSSERGRSYINIARAMANGKTDDDMRQVYNSTAANVFDTLNQQIKDEKKK